MKILSVFILTILTLSVSSQKKAITTKDFAGWKRIENRNISNNGKLISYELNPQKGDGKLLIYNTDQDKNDTINRGCEAKFSPNTVFIAYKIKPAEDSIKSAKRAELKKEKMPKDSLGIHNLRYKKTTTFPKLVSFKVPEETSDWIAFLTEFEEPKKDSVSSDSISGDKKVKKNKKKFLKDRKELSVMNPEKKITRCFNRVEDYQWSKNGKILGITSFADDTSKLRVVIRFNTQNLTADTLLKDSVTIKNLAADDAGNQFAFLTSTDTTETKRFYLQYAKTEEKNIMPLTDTLVTGLPKDWCVSEFGPLYFSADGTKLFAGTNLKPIQQPKDTVLAEDKPKLDLWSWTDGELQPMQLKNLEKEKKRTYLAAYRIPEQKWVQLADSLMPNIQLINKNNGEVALLSDPNPYKRQTSWEDREYKDWEIISLLTGERKRVLTAKTNARLSPTGKYILYYEETDSSYYCIITHTLQKISLTHSLPVAFCDELNDMPTDPSPYGIAGWTDNDEFVLINDRFDIWKIDPTGIKKPTLLTQGTGRKNQTRFRYLKLDNEQVFIPLKESILLTAFNEKTCHEGYYTTSINSKNPPKELISGAYQIGYEQKAKEANTLIWAKQTPEHYPEIIISDLSLKKSQVVSTTNPQQNVFNWTKVEFFYWNSLAGDSLRGLLYKPEDFQPDKKYPLIVYYYERSSDELFRHILPYPSHSIINPTHYCSNGYLVFIPDIVYKTGHPGQSAYDAIMSGVSSLLKNYSFIDSTKMGLQGQSWGGYQTAYLITRTQRFVAAMAGAPVSNMTSAYGGIRWGTGMSRMFQYEHSQSRIGATLWEKPELYIENSPLFSAPKVTTPLLIMSNDNDGAVPWYQGIELFTALRRLDKPVWLLNYNGMEHNLETKYWANRMDLTERMMQFFDHYLKDTPAPEWMTKGIPAIEKGKNRGIEKFKTTN